MIEFRLGAIPNFIPSLLRLKAVQGILEGTADQPFVEAADLRPQLSWRHEARACDHPDFLGFAHLRVVSVFADIGMHEIHGFAFVMHPGVLDGVVRVKQFRANDPDFLIVLEAIGHPLEPIGTYHLSVGIEEKKVFAHGAFRPFVAGVDESLILWEMERLGREKFEIFPHFGFGRNVVNENEFVAYPFRFFDAIDAVT